MNSSIREEGLKWTQTENRFYRLKTKFFILRKKDNI